MFLRNLMNVDRERIVFDAVWFFKESYLLRKINEKQLDALISRDTVEK